MKLKQTFCLYEDQLEILKKQSEKTGAPMAEILRRAIDAYFGIIRGTQCRQVSHPKTL
jgi:hypothetical protein